MNKSPVLVLLAGGKSIRMGMPKGLLDFQGTFWILEQISRFKIIDNPTVYVGLGYDHRAYLEAIPWFKEALDSNYIFDRVTVRVFINNTPQNGAFSTLTTVLKEIDPERTVLVQPIDVPMPNTRSLQAILGEKNRVVIPKCDGRNGHPVKLRPSFWKELLAVQTLSDKARLDTQIKQLNNSSITYAKVNDSAVYQNINTKKDWNNFSNLSV